MEQIKKSQNTGINTTRPRDAETTSERGNQQSNEKSKHERNNSFKNGNKKQINIF